MVGNLKTSYMMVGKGWSWSPVDCRLTFPSASSLHVNFNQISRVPTLWVSCQVNPVRSQECDLAQSSLQPLNRSDSTQIWDGLDVGRVTFVYGPPSSQFLEKGLRLSILCLPSPGQAGRTLRFSFQRQLWNWTENPTARSTQSTAPS